MPTFNQLVRKSRKKVLYKSHSGFTNKHEYFEKESHFVELSQKRVLYSSKTVTPKNQTQHFVKLQGYA